MNEKTNIESEGKTSNIKDSNIFDDILKEFEKEKSTKNSEVSFDNFKNNKVTKLNKQELPVSFINEDIKSEDDSFEYNYEDDWFNDNNELVFDQCDDPGDMNWQIYRRGNILGQLIREFVNEEIEEYKGKLNDAFKGGTIYDMVKEYNLTTGKSCICFDTRKQYEKKLILYLCYNKQVKKYEINISEYPIKIFTDNHMIKNKELKELFDKINEISESNPFISIAVKGHVQPVVDYDKKHLIIYKIKSLLYMACNKDKKISLTYEQIYNSK